MIPNLVPLPPFDSELALLVESMCDGTMTPSERDRLETLLESDDRAKLYYVACLDLHAQMRWLMRGEIHNHDGSGSEAGDGPSPNVDRDARTAGLLPLVGGSATPLPPVVIDTSLPPSSGFMTPPLVGYFSQVGPFSYLVSTVIMCVAVLIAWQYKMGEYPQIAERDRPVTGPQDADAAFVGRVSGMDDCQWAEAFFKEARGHAPRGSALSLDSRVSIGRKIQLDAGLIEISYQTGAKVILEGPVEFDVGSNGGFLAAGRLTGRLETKAKPSDPRSPMAHPFCIRTPTAVVTDLGTEFGVAVEKDGRTTSHVFRGSVTVSPVARSGAARSVVVKKDESVRVEIADGQAAPTVKRVEVDSDQFVRHLHAGRVPIRVFGSGVGVKGGYGDPHWQVVAASNDPSFQPRAATVVTSIGKTWSPNNPGREQWVAPDCNCRQAVPRGTTFAFRTSFDLDRGQPEKAVLRGRIFVVDRVVAIRLNGRVMPNFAYEPPAKYSWETGDVAQALLIDHGFVAGTNVLEIEVASGEQLPLPEPFSCLGLRVELEGAVQLEP